MNLLTMAWRDALFAHWPVPPETVRERLPPGLSPDTYDGEAWLGVVGFEMADLRPRGSPVGLSFPEFNLRTYVDGPRGRGVYFHSLDAADRLGVTVARSLFRLPYYRARMRMDAADPPDPADRGVRLRSRRVGGTPLNVDVTYGPTGEPFTPEPGSLPAFLTERYRYYAASDAGRLYTGTIAHEPWTLRAGVLDVRHNDAFRANGYDHPGGEPLVHVCDGIDVTAGGLGRVTDQ